MTTMTDEAAQKIARQTIDKFAKADRAAYIVSRRDDNTIDFFVYGSEDKLVKDSLEVLYNVLGDDAEKVFKEAAKIIKKKRKEAKK